MSTKIFEAWRVKTTSIRSLVEIGEKVREFHSWEHLSPDFQKSVEYMAPVMPELYEVPRLLKRKDKDFFLSSLLAEDVVGSLLDQNTSRPVWVATDEDRAFMKWKLHNSLELKKRFEPLKDMKEEVWEKFQDLFVLAYEQFSQSQNPQLVFVEGEDGWTYIKGFGLSSAAQKYLDETYENFEYTNQTEMGANFFPKDIQEKVKAAASKEEAYEMLLAAQEERGKLWDKALGKHSSFRYAGLHFPVNQDDRRVFRFFQETLAKYAKEKRPKSKEE